MSQKLNSSTKSENLCGVNCIIIFVVICIIWLACMIYQSEFSKNVILEIITAISLWFVAYVTAKFAINKYHQEQRTSRIQKLYFEDASLGQIKAMEETLSQAKKSIYSVRSVFHMIEQLLYKEENKEETVLDNRKEILLEKIKNSKNSIALKEVITGFKKETIATFLYDAEKIIGWIEAFELDASSLFYDLESLLLITENALMRLKIYSVDNPFEELKEKINRIYFIRVERHGILFSLLSIIVVKLANENYSSVSEISDSFRKDPGYKKLIEFADKAYKELVEDFIEYTLCSRVALPDNDPEKAEKYMLYLSDNGEYIFRDLAENIQRGYLPTIPDLDLSNLSAKLQESPFKKKIIFIISQIHPGFNNRSMDDRGTAEELWGKVKLAESEFKRLRREISELRKTI